MAVPRVLICALVLLVAGPAPAGADQPTPSAGGDVTIPRLERAPALEDFLGMAPSPALEGRMARVEGFIQQTPSDGQPSSERTDVYLGYDDRNLYVVFVAFDSQPDRVRARLTRRENLSNEDDWVEVAVDTFNDRRRGYLFDCNPLGVQWDALWSEAGGEDASFDTLWASRGQVTSQGYVVWMAIPFKSLRFPPSATQQWGLIFTRWIARVPEKSTWPHVSSRIQGRMNQAGTLRGLEDISPGRNVQLIPYGVSRSFRALDRRDPAAPRFVSKRAELDVGLDAKLVAKDSLVADFALNPDFSQVESDEPQVTVNQRFEVRFPEKRPFFIENASYFDTPINLLFTRRIADPRLGARLTGKIGRTSIGALVADDEAPGKRVPAGDPLDGTRAWFGVVRVNRDILNESSVGVIYTGRRYGHRTNRVFGFDGRLKLGPNWVASAQGVTSLTDLADGSRLTGPAFDVHLTRTGRQLELEFQYTDIGPGFRADTGFVRRTDIRHLRQEVGYAWRPETPVLTAWGPGFRTNAIYDHAGTRLDVYQEAFVTWEFRRQTGFGLFAEVGRERLRAEDFPGLPASRDFSRNAYGGFGVFNALSWVGVDVEWIRRTRINVQPPAGDLPTAAWSTEGTFRFTVRPETRLRIDNAYVFERLTDRALGTRIYHVRILRSKWNWQFTRALSARAILQYDTLRANPALSGLDTTRNFNADFLVTYLVNPWTALYAGYNGNQQNIALMQCSRDVDCQSRVVRTDRLASDARGLFLKFSYLLRY